MTCFGYCRVRQEDFPYPAYYEVGFDTADLVLFLKGKAQPNLAFGNIRSFTIGAVFGGKAGGSEFRLAGGVVRAGLVRFVQEIRMQGIDREPLAGLDIVVSIAWYSKRAHDEAKQGRRTSANVYKGTEYAQVFGTPISFGTYEVNTTRPRQGIHKMAAVHGIECQDVVEQEVQRWLFWSVGGTLKRQKGYVGAAAGAKIG